MTDGVCESDHACRRTPRRCPPPRTWSSASQSSPALPRLICHVLCVGAARSRCTPSYQALSESALVDRSETRAATTSTTGPGSSPIDRRAPPVIAKSATALPCVPGTARTEAHCGSQVEATRTTLLGTSPPRPAACDPLPRPRAQATCAESRLESASGLFPHRAAPWCRDCWHVVRLRFALTRVRLCESSHLRTLASANRRNGVGVDAAARARTSFERARRRHHAWQSRAGVR